MSACFSYACYVLYRIICRLLSINYYVWFRFYFFGFLERDSRAFHARASQDYYGIFGRNEIRQAAPRASDRIPPFRKVDGRRNIRDMGFEN